MIIVTIILIKLFTCIREPIWVVWV